MSTPPEPPKSQPRPVSATIHVVPGFEAVVQACRTVLMNHTAAGLERVFLDADDTLFDCAEHAENNQVQSMFLDSMREVRKQRASIERECIRQLAQHFTQYFQFGQTAPLGETDHPTDSLSLVEHDEFEERLQIEHAAALARQNHYALLLGIEARIRRLAGREADGHETTFAPRTVATCFQRALGISSLPAKVKRVLHTLFEQQVVRNIGDLYRRLDKVLVDAGLPAPERPQPIASRPPSMAQDASNARTANRPAPTHADLIQQIDDIRRAISQLQRATTQVQKLPGGSRPVSALFGQDAVTYSHEALDTSLARLQRKAANTNTPITAEQLKHALHQELSRDGDVSGLAATDAQVIDLVGMLFDYIQRDPNTAAPFKTAMGRLQLPFLRCALDDPAVLADQTHPLRYLLDRLSYAIERVAGNEASQSQLMHRFREVNGALLSDEVPSSSMLMTLTLAVDNFISELENKARLREQREIEAAQGHDRLTAARRRTAAIIARLSNDHRPPTNVEDFLRRAWSDVLVFIHLRHGEGSRAWASAIRTTQQVARGALRGRDGDQQALTEELGNGLRMLGRFSENSIEKVLNTLLPESPTAPAAPLPVETILADRPPLADALSVAPNDDPQDQTLLARIAQLQQLGFGRQFEFIDGQQRVRLKLSWFSPTTRNYMFVDHTGKRMAVKHIRQLALEMESGTARLLDMNDQPPLIDRAMLVIHRMLARLNTRD
jgi:hypothetical protein